MGIRGEVGMKEAMKWWEVGWITIRRSKRQSGEERGIRGGCQVAYFKAA